MPAGQQQAREVMEIEKSYEQLEQERSALLGEIETKSRKIVMLDHEMTKLKNELVEVAVKLGNVSWERDIEERLV